MVRGYVVTDPDTLADVAEFNAPVNEGFLEIPLDVRYDVIATCDLKSLGR